MLNGRLFPKEELDRYCRWNGGRTGGNVKRVVLEFQGLNRVEMPDQPSPLELELGERHVLYVIPYTAPWSWMNRSAVIYTDVLVESLFRALDLPSEVPLVSSGYSMGGQAALMYTLLGGHRISACYANSPVCDLTAHFQEREDIPRTLVNAFACGPGSLEAELEAHSPLFRAEELPDIPYMIVAGGADRQVHKNVHSDRFVSRMRELGRNVRYCEPADMKHWQITDYQVYRAYENFICGDAQDVAV